jgi:hypothetical protein
VPHDPRIRHQTIHVGWAESRNALEMETLEDLTKRFALAKDRQPTEPA